jgi:small-conductance mechanosensitive channel
VTFESNWRKAKELLTEISHRHAAVSSDEAARQVRRAASKYMIRFEYLTPIVWTSVADIGVTLTIRFLTDPRRRRSAEAAIWEEILETFAAHDDIDFAYPTQRFYDNVTEGKPGARAPAPGDD